MVLSNVVSLILLVGFFAGMVGLFMVGFTQLTSVLIRRTGSFVRFLLRANVDGNADGAVARIRPFFRGLIAALATGSVVATTISVITSTDGAQREPGAPDEAGPHVLLGANLGGALACWVPALILFYGSTFAAGLLLMGFALVLRLYPTNHGVDRADLLTGVAILLISVDLLAGRISFIDTVPFSVAALSSGTAFPPAVFAAVTGLFLGLTLAAATRSTVATAIIVTALAVHRVIPLQMALFAVTAGNAAPGIAGFYASRPLGAAARSTAGRVIVTAALALFTGAILAFLLPFLMPPGSGPAFGDSPAVTATLLAAFHTLLHVLVVPLFALTHMPMDLIIHRIATSSGNTDGQAHPEPLAFIQPGYPESLDANLVLTRSALARMADRSYEMLMIVMNSTQVDDAIEEATDRVIDLRGQVKDMEEQILQPLSRSIQLPCSPAQADRIQQHQRIAQELSLVGDDCYKTIRLLARSYRKNLRFHQESRDELFGYTSRILDFLRYNADYLEGKIDQPDWEIANSMEETIDGLRDKLKKRSRKVLEKSDDADIRGELTFIDIVSHLEHVGDRCLNIAETVRRLSRS